MRSPSPLPSPAGRGDSRWTVIYNSKTWEQKAIVGWQGNSGASRLRGNKFRWVSKAGLASGARCAGRDCRSATISTLNRQDGQGRLNSQRVDLIVGAAEPEFDALAFQQSEAFDLGDALVLGRPEAGATGVDFVDDGFVQPFERDDAGVERQCAFLFTGFFKNFEVVAAQLVQDENVVEPRAETCLLY